MLKQVTAGIGILSCFSPELLFAASKFLSGLLECLAFFIDSLTY